MLLQLPVSVGASGVEVGAAVGGAHSEQPVHLDHPHLRFHSCGDAAHIPSHRGAAVGAAAVGAAVGLVDAEHSEQPLHPLQLHLVLHDLSLF